MGLEQTICPECGTGLSGEPWTPGLCPHCSLLLALEPSSEGPTEMSHGEDSPDTPTLAYPKDSLFEGQTLGGRFRIRALLGRGGMGEVWRALDLKLRVDVALKALRPELLTDERALESLRQEVRTAREVISPNVCRVFDLVELDGRELVSMEYIDGITLLDILKMRAPLPLTEAREIAAQFLAGLEAIHEAGLVHRDVKPENLMMTRSGRMVLMDFGIAKGLAEGTTGTVSGTPAYMAPEQARGEAPNARVDVFSAGVVLAEMIAPDGLATFEARQAIWQGIHDEPPKVPDSPWASVLTKAVARLPDHRYAGAAALSRALEEVTLRVDRAEDVQPYPGLASFTSDNAEYFFGRELEIEEMWKKLRRPKLYGLIGPSGAGKSSFLRAGLLAVTPTGWRAVVVQPGNQPFANLARALVPELSEDTEALQLLVDATDNESLLTVVSKWRRGHDQVLVVLDQFEELFTQNPPEVQDQFAELLAKLVLDADAHVLLAMRDDFLFYCSGQPALSPMFAELTPLRPPSGTALRRALVQPALKCGYRFEDDSLIDEKIAEVEHERGALPLLAFAAARLWDHRDRERGLLTREAYDHIGGVAGALAQHAEQTLETIGHGNIPIVRELFRNLVTAEGTRAARTREELLSVFAGGHDPRDARDRVPPTHEVLDTLIDARLLTSFEVPAADDDEPRQRVEIIHESLLSNWPRLVRWQTQDQDGALLRDQLRQAAQMWEERGHPDDLLWTDTSYNEYELWRDRYSGGLSTTEEAFATGMKSHAERRKRRRRMILAAVIAVLAIGLGIVGSFWRQAVAARDRAREEERRATASQLLALGQLELDKNNSAALAYALASLEHADSPVTRLFALKALWQGPTALAMDDGVAKSIDFSPDGRWLAAGFVNGDIRLWPSTGGPSRLLHVPEETEQNLIRLRFGPDSDCLVSQSYESNIIRIWSIPDGRLLRTITSDERLDFRLATEANRLLTFADKGDRTEVTSWPLGEGEPEPFGNIPGDDLTQFALYAFAWNLQIDPAGTRVAYVPFKEGTSPEEIRLLPLGTPAGDAPELMGPGPAAVTRLGFHPDGEHLASADFAGGVRIWSLDRGAEVPYRVLRPRPAYLARSLRFDGAGSRLAAAGWGGRAALWNLAGPPDADPLLVHRGETHFMLDAALHPQGNWLATASVDRGVNTYPIERRYPQHLNGHTGDVRSIAFLPGGESIASVSSDGTLRLWPLSPTVAGKSRTLLEREDFLLSVVAGPHGKRLLTVQSTGRVWLVPVDGSPPRQLTDPGGPPSGMGRGRLALGSRTAAAARLEGDRGMIDLWDLDSGRQRTLDVGGKAIFLTFTPDERLVVSTWPGGVHLWQLESATAEPLSDRPGLLGLSRDGRFLITSGEETETTDARIHDLEDRASWSLDSHGPAESVALDAAGRIAVTSWNDQLRVGPATGGAPHLLLGPEAFIHPIVSPDGQWIAALDGSHTLTLWPVPDLSQPPLHTLPHDELLAKLRALTNLRVVSDLESETGWSRDIDPFPGWEKVPSW